MACFCFSQLAQLRSEIESPFQRLPGTIGSTDLGDKHHSALCNCMHRRVSIRVQVLKVAAIGDYVASTHCSVLTTTISLQYPLMCWLVMHSYAGERRGQLSVVNSVGGESIACTNMILGATAWICLYMIQVYVPYLHDCLSTLFCSIRNPKAGGRLTIMSVLL